MPVLACPPVFAPPPVPWPVWLHEQFLLDIYVVAVWKVCEFISVLPQGLDSSRPLRVAVRRDCIWGGLFSKGPLAGVYHPSFPALILAQRLFISQASISWCTVMPGISFTMRQWMASTILTGHTPGILSRASRRPVIRARYAPPGGELLANHQVHLTSSSLRASDSALNGVYHSFNIIKSILLGPPEPPHLPYHNLDITGCDVEREYLGARCIGLKRQAVGVVKVHFLEVRVFNSEDIQDEYPGLGVCYVHVQHPSLPSVGGLAYHRSYVDCLHGPVIGHGCAFLTVPLADCPSASTSVFSCPTGVLD